jgi:hypothetical protein
MFSSAGRTFTQMCGRYSAGMNLFRESVGISSRSAVQGSTVPRIVLRATIYCHPKRIRHIPSIEKEEQPGKDRQGWEKELSRYWHEQSEHQKGRCACFHQRPRSLTDRKREDSEYDQYQIMPVIVRPSVMSESPYRVCWTERGLDSGNR